MRKPDRLSPGATVRCAIYTRKSTEEGLEQEFNSLDAQREACAGLHPQPEARGLDACPTIATTTAASPAAPWSGRRCSACWPTSRAGKVDVVVVYKVDRLTRSLVDFARIVEVFEPTASRFVSVTQQFNTTTSMGRLTLNMLLSFAQFEREVIAERIRDKIAASQAQGHVDGRHAAARLRRARPQARRERDEAEIVRTIFRRYAELGSVRAARGEELARPWHREQALREGAGGVLAGGHRFSRGALYTLLQNRIYCGEITHAVDLLDGDQTDVGQNGLYPSLALVWRIACS